MTDRLLELLADGLCVYDLGRPMFPGMPQSPAHPEYRLVIPRRHGDVVRGDGSSAANEMIFTGGHVGTHIDALAHISYQGELYGGVSVAATQSGQGFSALGIDTVAPIVTRGLLLDVPRALKMEECSPDRPISPADLEMALELTGKAPAPNNVLLIRTGWGRHFGHRAKFEGDVAGAPGPGEEGARWLAEFSPKAVGSDTIAFDHIPAGTPQYILPAHRHLIVECGIHIIEVLDLERLSADGVYEFTFVLSPLRLVGATGSPVRPLALVDRSGDRTA
jgi:kynurenine formamidase